MKDKMVQDTIEWSKRLGEEYTDTTAGRIIDFKRERVESAMNEDPKLASVLALELAKTCNQLEQERGFNV